MVVFMDVELRAILAMGVCGSGKSTFGRALADQLNADFIEGDDYHSAENVAKMASGKPLDDADRWPWLRALNAEIRIKQQAGRSIVFGCSALKAAYRELLSEGVAGWAIVYLEGSRELLHARLEGRAGHFMQSAMLESQLATLEVPDEAIVVSIADPVAVSVERVLKAL